MLECLRDIESFLIAEANTPMMPIIITATIARVRDGINESIEKGKERKKEVSSAHNLLVKTLCLFFRQGRYEQQSSSGFRTGEAMKGGNTRKYVFRGS